MLGFAWLTLRQAREAIQNGRLEEAHRLLYQDGAVGYRGSGELLQQVARGLLERARRRLKEGDTAATWNDLLLAEQIGGADNGAADLRQELGRAALTEARSYLDAGEAVRAAEVLSQLSDRGVRLVEVRMLEDAAKHWIRARDLAGRGEFGPALQAAQRVAEHLPKEHIALARFETELRGRAKGFNDLVVQLHDAVGGKDGRRMLILADQILALAPQHEEARKARACAWKAVEAATVMSPRPEPATSHHEPPPPRSPRFLLWVDGVGGYLVCLGERVILGQAAPDACADVPLFADISRAHATLSRDAEGYLLEAARTATVNGHPVDRALLKPGDRVTLGGTCELRFSQPVPVSATAQIEVISGHRLAMAVDKIFLMADTLVLGPSAQSHVVLPDIRQAVVLYRNRDGLGVRYAGSLTVDGQTCRERGTLGPSSQVTGEDFSFAIEPLEARTGHG